MLKSINRALSLCSIHVNKPYLHNYNPAALLSTLPVRDKNSIFTPLTLSKRFINKKASKQLQKLLDINIHKANCILSQESDLSKVPETQLEKNYMCCIKYGLSNKTISNIPNILSDSCLPTKLEALKNLPYDVNVTTPLLLLPLKKFMGFLNDESSASKINELAKLFKVEVSDVCVWISTKQFLTSISIDMVKECLQLLLDSGVPMEAVIKDLWVLRYSPSVMQERIDLAKENNIEHIKPWMIRAQKEIFYNYIRRRSDTKEILGEKSNLMEYLSDKLECSLEVSKYIITKQPALQKKSLKKMDEMIDFLFSHGFKPIQICRAPKILLHSVTTIHKRLRELDASNVKLDSLHILTKSQKQYTSIIDSMKANKIKIKN